MNKVRRSLPLVDVSTSALNKNTNAVETQISRHSINLETRISHRNEFELSYLRWRYLLRAPNPDVSVLKKYERAAYKSAKESYKSNSKIYKASGMEIEDVCNIALVYLVSYLGVYSVQYCEDAKSSYTKEFEDVMSRAPTEEELAKKDLAKMICFINQRMSDLIRVCKQKNRNITGELSATGLFKLVGREVDTADINIFFHPADYGYAKVTKSSEYKEVRKKMGPKFKPGRFVLDGVVYRFVSEILSPVWISDYENPEEIGLFNPQDETASPEYQESLVRRFKMENLLEKYKKSSVEKKRKLLGRAIKFLSVKDGFNKEIAIARDLLGKLR